MKRIIHCTIATAIVCCLNTTTAAAQGNNSGQGGDDKNVQSIANRVLKLEKSSEAFNVFLNLHTSYQERFDGDDKGGSFKGRQLRLEMKGELSHQRPLATDCRQEGVESWRI